jgi:hypothetical protein
MESATFKAEIDASHPVRLDTKEAYAADSIAMQLVGERHAKRDLVNLVRWLILGGAIVIQQKLSAETDSSSTESK